MTILPFQHHTILHGIVLTSVIRLPTEESSRTHNAQLMVPHTTSQRKRLCQGSIEEITWTIIITGMIKLATRGCLQCSTKCPVRTITALRHKLQIRTHEHIATQASLLGISLMLIFNAAYSNIFICVLIPFHHRHPQCQVRTLRPQRHIHFQHDILRVVTSLSMKVITEQLDMQFATHMPIQHIRHRECIRTKIIG